MKKTSLYQRHVDAGAKMVDFGGWLMPVQYAGVLKEHEAVRSRVGLFDVSHMGEFFITGEDACAFIDRVVTNDVASLKEGKVLYTVMCNRNGGVVDDLLVYCIDSQDYLLVVNASNIEKDFDWILSLHENEKVKIKNRSGEFGLIAIQGPKAETVLRKIADFQEPLGYYELCNAKMGGTELTVSRTGYTGEDGFEVMVETEKAGHLWDALMEAGKDSGISPAGLAARDLLRIEAGYSLYGHELDDTIDPKTAGLSWAVKMDGPDFVGKKTLQEFKPSKRKIGFCVEGKGIARQGYPIIVDGEKAGEVTSGTFSPVLQKPIGIGYISRRGKIADAKLEVEIRGKAVPATYCRMPFIKLGTIRRSNGIS